jgi:hypothetical protein
LFVVMDFADPQLPYPNPIMVIGEVNGVYYPF